MWKSAAYNMVAFVARNGDVFKRKKRLQNIRYDIRAIIKFQSHGLATVYNKHKMMMQIFFILSLVFVN